MNKTRRFILVLAVCSFLLPSLFAQKLPPLPFDHILHYDELTKLLHAWADARPNLVQLESIGTTPEGRAIWFLTLTNGRTGPALEKPALVIDGNMHATEWGGGVAALHFVWRLLEGYGTDERITRLLDTRTIYVLPRMTPEESTLAISTATGELSSSVSATRTGHGSNTPAILASSFLVRPTRQVATTGGCCRKG